MVENIKKEGDKFKEQREFIGFRRDSRSAFSQQKFVLQEKSSHKQIEKEINIQSPGSYIQNIIFKAKNFLHDEKSR